MTSTATIIHATSSATKTPGPGAYMPPSMFGNESPKYTIKNRYKDRPNTTDGSFQNIPSTIGTGHKYSFGVRPKDSNKFVPPGPSYIPPAFGTDAHKSSFHSRGYEKKQESTPGPVAFDDPTRKQSPRYTMRPRIFMKDNDNCSPGPGKYNPDYDKVLPGTRKSTITSRHPGPKAEVTPGPYDVPLSPDLRPISFHRRHADPKRDDTPGPGKYNTDRGFGTDARKSAIHLRLEEKRFVNQAPYEKIPELFGNSGRKWSLSGRPKERNTESTPGPSYMPPAFGSDTTKVSFHGKGYEPKRAQSPGPYMVPIEPGGRKYSIKGRNYAPDAKNNGPGPGKYNPNYDVTLPSSPKTGIRVKLQEPKPKASPGYYMLPPFSGPKITIGVRDNTIILPGVG